MSSLIALCVSIGVLGGVATYLALGPLAGFILIWGIFIGWATFFALGGDNAALKKGITCNVFGAVCAWLMAVILLATAAYLLQTEGALDMGPLASANFSNALILVSVSLVVGALFGLGSGKLGGVLTSGD